MLFSGYTAGVLSHFVDAHTDVFFNLETNTLQSIAALTLPNSGKKCLVMVFAAELPLRILCDFDTSLPIDYQTLDTPGAFLVCKSYYM